MIKDIDSLTYEDIQILGSVIASKNNEPLNSENAKKEERLFTSIGSFDSKEWVRIAWLVVQNNKDTENFNKLKDYFKKTMVNEYLWTDRYVLECMTLRMIDDEGWMFYVEFNSLYRPEVLEGKELSRLSFECCGRPNEFTKATADDFIQSGEGFCLHCNVFSKITAGDGYMKTINKFTIQKITMKGFKKHLEPISYDLSRMTYIYGKNKEGKTTIADSIAYAFTGQSFFGESADFLINYNNCCEMEVCIELADEENQPHTLIRSKIKGKTVITFDGIKVRQEDITRIFCEKDLFLSMFNPTYFVNELAKDGRDLLEKMLPVIPHDEILAKLSEGEQDLLRSEHISSPEIYIKNKRAEIRELSENIIHSKAQQELLDSQAGDRKKEISTVMAEIEKQKSRELEISDIRAKDWDKQKADEDIARLADRLDELKDSDGDYEKISVFKENIQKIEMDIAINRHKTYVSQYSKSIGAIEADFKTQIAEYRQMEGMLKSLSPGWVCPACASELPESNVQITKKHITEKLKKCMVLGKEQKQALFNMKQEEEKNKAIFEANKASEHNRLSEELLSLKEAVEQAELNDMSLTTAINKTTQELTQAELHKVYGNLTPELRLELNGCTQEIFRLEEELDKLTQADEAAAKTDYSEYIVNTQKEISVLELKVNAAKSYTAEKNKLLFDKLKMNRVRFQLFDVVKSTGEMKEVFKFTYNGRSFNGLSFSEKVLAKLEISEMIKRISGKDYPVFIDNMESIDAIDNVKPSGQVILAYKVANQKLTVKGKESQPKANPDEMRKAG